jgi:hypothetical protein
MFAYAPGHEQEAARAIQAAEGIAYRVTLDSGVRVDHTI